MTDRIDCSLQSHPACFEPEADAPDRVAAPVSQGKAHEPTRAECINECVSSLGVAVLVSSAVVGLGCLISKPACPVLIGASVGGPLAWCDAQCDPPAVDETH